MKKELVAMLLAGGQGSRLYALTSNVAKPAVPFGGKYRIIDFPLSNCVNSGIDTVGVLTQYRPLELNSYLGNGQPWDLDRLYGGVHVLPPYQQASGSDWYKGTANAIYQNISFIERYNPQYVIILSGDQICKQDYSDFLKFHKEKNAEFSVAVMEVPWAEAPRFGIMSVNGEDMITEFAEKPKEPKSNLASMGIYVFSWKALRQYLTEDEADPGSENDFGKNIIPNMLNNRERMAAYRFDGYWKDVGTITSLWEANMDLLGPRPVFSLEDDTWRVFTRHDPLPPQFIGDSAKIKNSIITEGCEIYGTVENAVLFPSVRVMPGAIVRDTVVMDGTVIEEDACVEYSILDSNVHIGTGAHIGGSREGGNGLTVIGEGVAIGDNKTVEAGMMLPDLR